MRNLTIIIERPIHWRNGRRRWRDIQDGTILPQREQIWPPGRSVPMPSQGLDAKSAHPFKAFITFVVMLAVRAIRAATFLHEPSCKT